MNNHELTTPTNSIRLRDTQGHSQTKNVGSIDKKSDRSFHDDLLRLTEMPMDPKIIT